MMRRSGSPRALVAAVVAALSQGACVTGDGDSASGQRLDTEEGSSGRHGDHDDGDCDDGDHDDGDHDDGDHDDGDDGDDGSCPVDPCEGLSDEGALFIATDCGTLELVEDSIDFTCRGAIERCQDLALADPDRSILCEWLGAEPSIVELFRHEADPDDPQCDALRAPPDCEPGPPHCEIPCDDDEPGSYRGFYCGPDGQRFIETEGITCQEALGNCALNAALNPDKDIVCDFDGEEIFRREVNDGACVAQHGEPTFDCDVPLPALCEGSHPCLAGGTSTYRGSFCDGNSFIETPHLDCQSALGNCILNASLDLTRSIRCQWDGEEIYRSEVEEGACEEFDPICEVPAP